MLGRGSRGCEPLHHTQDPTQLTGAPSPQATETGRGPGPEASLATTIAPPVATNSPPLASLSPPLSPASTGHAAALHLLGRSSPWPTVSSCATLVSGRLVLNVPQECMAAEPRRRLGPRGVVLWEAVVMLLYLRVPAGYLYNLDPGSALLYQGPSGTLFGYSVVLHSHGEKRW